MSDSSPGDEVPSQTYTFSHEEDKSVHSQLQENIYIRPNERNDSFSGFDPNIDFDADSILEEDSPYPEVRSAVANFDDPDMPVSTIRAWSLGIIWTIILAGINQLTVYRFPSIYISGLVALLVIFPCGQAWARFCVSISVFGLPLNPGPFTIKEHTLSVIMAGVAAQATYSTDIIAVQRVFYGEIFSFAFQWMLTVATMSIGLSLSGIMYRFLVTPPSMIWQNTLVECALLNTLHSQQYAGIGGHRGPSRVKFFLMAFIGAVLWSFFPSYLFTALSVFSWPCWIAPNNIKVNQLFGINSGLGLSFVTFDWNQIAYIESPLATPWWSEANVVAGFILVYVILAPVLYYTNVWYSQYLPITSTSAFDNTGHVYNSTRVLRNGTLDMEAYKSYSPLYLPIGFALSYGVSFIAIGATASHAIIYLRKPILLHFKQEQSDIHARLMMKYPQVKGWYYAAVFAVTFTMACVCIKLWPTGMKIWELLVALAIASVLVLPIGMIQAVTNRQIPVNVFTELISGFILPGRPIAMMMFKTYGYYTTFQAVEFAENFKLGHYMKIPPRVMFWGQIIATLISGLVQLGVQMWLFAHIPVSIEPVFGTASIIAPLMFFFLIGVACPAVLWALSKRFPDPRLKYIHFPVLFGGLGYAPPGNGVNYLNWALVGFIFQHVVRRRSPLWWRKYNYVLSSALDVGTSVGLILIYFCLQYPMNGNIGVNTVQKWWGNTVYTENLDWKAAPLRTLAAGETFGRLYAYFWPRFYDHGCSIGPFTGNAGSFPEHG
ncbi:small oligopeptide transporter [Gymnopus androsaceus JB14]|uniref:Small oligopeptide transporter n=1 Tax=Gymnopus androsaceus JB14 TaxID=1447944 RepID=A0A6A4GRK6_9AGAR|nr:small oligopeptide transporter [Gymnopus androsaceus JB14]